MVSGAPGAGLGSDGASPMPLRRQRPLIPQDAAWRIFTKGFVRKKLALFPRCALRETLELGRKILDMVSIIA